MQLQDLFDRILAGETVVLQHADRRDLNSTTAAIRRKFARYTQIFVDMGAPNPYAGQYIRIAWDSSTLTGTYSLQADEMKSNRCKIYKEAEL